MKRRPRRKRATDDPARLSWTRRQLCCAPVLCNDAAEAHHPRQHAAGLASRAPDDTAIPLCRRHHGELHGLSGVFRDWDRARLQAWERERVAEHRAMYEGRERAT